MLDITKFDFDKALVEQLQPLHNFALSLTKNSDRAEDLVQETVLRAASHKEQFEPGSNFGAWIFTICRNQFYSTVRKKKEDEDPEGVHESHLADEGPSQEESASDELEGVQLLLSTLPAEMQDVVKLRVGGASYADIAKELGIEEGTVKSRLHRAREALDIAGDARGVKRRGTRLAGLTADDGRFRKVDVKSFPPIKFDTELTERPKLYWLPLTRLFIDEGYQRSILERGISRVAKIAREFSWKKFAAIVVAQVGDKYAIVDGQHRTYAAALRGISEVPCLVIQATTEEQAAAFAAINGEVTKINSYQVHAAKVIAGDPQAVELNAVCQEAGVVVSRYATMEKQLKPGQTLAVGTIAALLRIHGKGVVLLALRCIQARHSKDVGALRGPIIRAMAETVAHYDEARPSAMLQVAQGVNFKAELLQARIRASEKGSSIKTEMRARLFELFAGCA